MEIGDTFKNYKELAGLFTYKITSIKNDTIKMDVLFPESWQVPSYKTKFNIYSFQKYLVKI